MYQDLNDQELVSLYIQGKEAAFHELINRHQNRIYSYLYMMVKNSDVANDLFQDAFVKVVRTLKMGKYNEEGKFLPWVMRIAHNLAIDYFRKESKMPKVRNTRVGDDEEFDIFSILKLNDDTYEDELVMQQILNDVRKLVDHLPDDQREVVMMRHYQEMSFKDIAEKTGVSINTALGRMRYALINLRKLIEEHQMVMTVA
jgi:RNA polymerase sigma-70 factor (ECF subfamily)